MALHDSHDADDHAHHQGLAADLRVLSRRRLFGLVAKGVAGLSLIPVISNCATDGPRTSDEVGSDTGSGTGSGGTCATIPEETEGPYWPHVHFEVYPSQSEATTGANKIATSQLALPEATCDAVYATPGYSASVTNLAQTSLATDLVFSDGATLEIPSVTGSVAEGFTAALTVAVAG